MMRRCPGFSITLMWIGLVGCILGLTQQGRAAITPADAEKLGVDAGLVVHVGSSDGTLESAMAASGRRLVHGLALDDAAVQKSRATILAAGRYGLASVAAWSDRSPLPYADQSVNLLLVDSPVPDAELLRVLVPGGQALIAAGAQPRTLTKPRPDAMDSWGHFDHSAIGNPVSADTFVAPVQQQQWVSALMPTPWSGNPAGYDPGAGLRVWDRYVVMDVHDEYAKADPKSRESWVLQCRDAFNGVPIWTLPRDSQVARQRWSLVVDAGTVYAWLKLDGTLTALDLATGKTLRTYPQTVAPEAMSDGETVCVRAAGKDLVVGLRDRMICFDAATAKPRWQYEKKDHVVLGTVVDAGHNRVYAITATPVERKTFGGRWPSASQPASVIALDLATGKTVWECSEIASGDKIEADAKSTPRTRGLGQLVVGDKHLIVFNSKAISGGKSQFIGAIDLASGKLIHATDDPFKSSYNTASYNVLWRDGYAWFAGAFTHVWRYDPVTGKVDEVVSNTWNQRCTRFTATPRYFLFGQAAYYKPDFTGTQVCVARSGCSLGNIPANGMTYFMPTACGCITMVRGFQAMTGSPPPASMPDNQRLQTPNSPPTKLTAPSALPAGEIAADWPKQWRTEGLETAPVKAGDLELVAVTHQHRLEARKNGVVQWSVIADARISTPPLVIGPVAVFGSHDGCVYGVSLPEGNLLWRYMLAPAARAIGVNGQLESTWPVYGVTELDGRIIASAGTHVELAGGVTVAALEARTGKPLWTRHLQKAASDIPAGGKGAKINAHSFINSVPRIEDDKIVLGDGGRKGGTFSFSPSESEAQLTEQLNAPPKK